MSVFELNNCYKRYGESVILKDVSVSIEKGQVVSLIGSSGSGKTTLLKCLTLLEKIDEGCLKYSDCIVSNANSEETYYMKDLSEIRKKFSLVFQNYNLFPHLNVLNNLCNAPINVLKKDRRTVNDKALELLDKFGLKDKAYYYPYQLSGGQKQRVAIIRALMMEPEIIYFDEPTSALDPEYTLEVLNAIKQLKKDNMTMFIVSHEMEFVKQVSDCVLFMENGEIIEKGTPDELFNSNNERVNSFLNIHAMDFKI